MLAQTRVLALAAAAGLASPAIGADRYWVAPLIGLWSDSSQWSTSSGGPSGLGRPQTGEDVYLDERSICIFNGAGIAIPNFGEITLSGVFSGVTSIQQGSSPWSADRMTIGLASDDCEFLMGGGSFIVGEMLVGKELGGNGRFETSDVADFLSTSVVNVGMNGAVGTISIGGNLFEFPEMNISFGLGNPGLGGVEVVGGTILGDTIRVGLAGVGDLSQSGGDMDVDGYTVGTQPSVPASSSTHTGGTLDVTGFLQIAPAFGNAILTIEGGDVSCGTLYMGEGPGATAELVLLSGVLDATNARIGIEGSATLEQFGGAFTATSVAIGELSGADTAVWECYGGTAMVSGDVRVGAGNTGDGTFVIDGGAVVCEDVLVAAANNSNGAVRLESGSLNAATLSIGVSEYAQYIQRGGSLTAGSVIVNPSGAHDALFQITGPNFGTASISAFTNNADTQIFGGVTAIGTLNNSAGAEFRLGNSPDVRVSSLVNDGSFVFGTAGVILSGPYVSFPVELRLIGAFQNNGTLTSTTGLAGSFVMNLTNDGVVNVLGSTAIDSDGLILNRGQINVDSDGGVFSANLNCNNVSGIDNQGTIFLDQGVIDTTSGDFVNNGEIQGAGRIQGGLINNGLIGRGGQLSELSIHDGVSFSATSTLEIQRYPGLHNTVRVASGDAVLGGALHVDFEFFEPGLGAQYTVLTTDAGSVIGTFDSVVVTDANAEIVYTPTSVIVQVTGCNGADLALPLGTLDFSDVVAFLSAFGSMNAAADLAPPFETFDFSDVVAFLTAFGGGCP